jgi:hypothetical protein
MFSGLNNLKVYDVFTPSAFDGDFSMTEDEARELLNEEQLVAAREWYNNYRVGNELLYTLYSVLSYLDSGKLDNYWGRSGTIELLIKLLNKKRTDDLAEMISVPGKAISTSIDSRLSYKKLLERTTESGYYSLAVQAGYLSHTPQAGKGLNIYHVNIHNKELINVWEEFILDRICVENVNELANVFASLPDTETFSKKLNAFIDYQLSYHDLDENLEKIYHILLLGMALGAGFKCSSNRECGLGRYDLFITGGKFMAIIELKKADEKEELGGLADEAIEQIDEKEYYGAILKEPSCKPLYKVGVACYKTKCHVKAVLHDRV